ncbi:hypothetical protein [Undibacterium sp. TJN19]|uniref:hypothetical protein n=1 Tax=Undibacterium sp. TJN19 TaxID=3413055 RepID=UPI003BF4410A
MATFCVTAANHKNIKNHCASSFNLWEKNTDDNIYRRIGATPLSKLVALIADGNIVLTGRENEDSITVGAPIEAELRIAKNEKHFPISEMPTF